MNENKWDELKKLGLDFQEQHIRRTYRQMQGEAFDALMDKLVQFVRLIPPCCTPLEKATLLYYVVSRCITYDYPSANEKCKDERQGYTYAGAVLNGTAVCNGISQVYARLCQASGVRCDIVEGYANDPAEKGLHAWVQVWLPDKQGQLHAYHCDPTWDLVEFCPDGDFVYFLKSDAYMNEHKHYWDKDWGKAQGKQKYAVCPRNGPKPPKIPEDGIEIMCQFFKKMKQPERFVLRA